MSAEPPTGTEISVIVCTHNRAADLERVLASLSGQRPTRHAWEVLVVDNQSTDDTPQVVSRWTDRLPLRYLIEPTLGLCNARNAGWRATTSPLVAYIDDDALAGPGWIGAVVTAFSAGGPELGCVGGRVDPIWEAARPSWLSDQVSLGLTIVNWSPAPRQILDLKTEWLVGANLAVRRTALQAVGGFSPGLDRVGHRLLSSGDVHLVQRIIDHGFRVEYHPAMQVRHRVPAARLTQAWFRRRYFWQGVSNAVMELLDPRPRASARVPAALRRALRLLRRPGELASLARPATDPAVFEQQCWTLIEVGHVAGLLGAGGR